MQHFLRLLVVAVFLSFVMDVSSNDYDRKVKALINVNNMNPDGSYFYEYLLDNGASQKVTGTLKVVNGEKVYSVEGSYSYDQEDGNTLTVKYIADENGFRILPDRKIALSNPVELPTRPHDRKIALPNPLKLPTRPPDRKIAPPNPVELPTRPPARKIAPPNPVELPTRPPDRKIAPPNPVELPTRPPDRKIAPPNPVELPTRPPDAKIGRPSPDESPTIRPAFSYSINAKSIASLLGG